MELALESALPRSPTAVTMLVTATVERLGMLPGLCASWGGVLSASVYLGRLASAPVEERARTAAQALTNVRSVFDQCAFANHCIFCAPKPPSRVWRSSSWCAGYAVRR